MIQVSLKFWLYQIKRLGKIGISIVTSIIALFHWEFDMRVFTFLWFSLIIWDYNYGNITPTKTIQLKIVIEKVLRNDCYELFFS